MDYEEEQQMELEALEAILGEDGVIKYIGTIPSGWNEDRPVYKVNVKPETDEDDMDISFDLLFQHTDMYPEEVPLLKVSSTRGLSDTDAEALTAAMVEAAEENVGMASIFAVMQAAKEWLENRAGVEAAIDPATKKKMEEEAEERRRLDARAYGTPVTPESFAVWRAKFDAEIAAAREASGEAAREAEKAARKTGKQWFTEKDRPEVPEGDDDFIESDNYEDSGSSDEDWDEDEDDEDDEFLNEYLAEQD